MKKDNIEYKLLKEEKFYDKVLLQAANRKITTDMLFGKIIGYKKVKVPVWETEKIPYIEKYYGESDHWGNVSDELEGYLIKFKEKKIKKIGYKWEKKPIFEKREIDNKPITFKRYSPITVEMFTPLTTKKVLPTGRSANTGQRKAIKPMQKQELKYGILK